MKVTPQSLTFLHKLLCPSSSPIPLFPTGTALCFRELSRPFLPPLSPRTSLSQPRFYLLAQLPWEAPTLVGLPPPHCFLCSCVQLLGLLGKKYLDNTHEFWNLNSYVFSIARPHFDQSPYLPCSMLDIIPS